MLRWKGSSHYLGMALAALIISFPVVLFSMATFVQATQRPIQEPLQIAGEIESEEKAYKIKMTEYSKNNQGDETQKDANITPSFQGRIAAQGLVTVKAETAQAQTREAVRDKTAQPEVVQADNAKAKEIAENNGYEQFGKEKLDKLAQKYNADPEYLYYIVQVEKTFNLDPCELLALIAQESGFKPQTHMDGGSLSYSTTQMKLPTAKTAYMAITEYYKIESIPFPTHELLRDDKYYAAFLAGGYLRYLHDVYNNDKYESYTAYNWGIGGRMTFYKNNGHFQSPYAIKVASLAQSFGSYVGEEYNVT